MLYEKVMSWAKHSHAEYYLSGLSFAESSFFPIPPDVMLMPMALATPNRAWFFALITTLASVLGGILGYMIGMFAYELVQPLLEGQWSEYYHITQKWFNEWGFWAIFIAGFSPIPYKVFTITAGILSMSFIPFIIASGIGRGGRFFLVAGLMRWGGKSMEQMLKKYIDIIGWLVIILAIIFYLLLR